MTHSSERIGVGGEQNGNVAEMTPEQAALIGSRVMSAVELKSAIDAVKLKSAQIESALRRTGQNEKTKAKTERQIAQLNQEIAQLRDRYGITEQQAPSVAIVAEAPVQPVASVAEAPVVEQAQPAAGAEPEQLREGVLSKEEIEAMLSGEPAGADTSAEGAGQTLSAEEPSAAEEASAPTEGEAPALTLETAPEPGQPQIPEDQRIPELDKAFEEINEALDRVKDETIGDYTEAEVEQILGGKDIESKLDELTGYLAKVNSEMRKMMNTYAMTPEEQQRKMNLLKEAIGDQGSLVRRILILRRERGKTPEGAGNPNAPVEDLAAGGTLDDLNPAEGADAEARDALAAQMLIDWAEAKYLSDEHGSVLGDESALRGMFLKERAALMAQGMSAEDAEKQIMETRGLDAEEIAKLKEGVKGFGAENDDELKDVDYYIELGDRALAMARRGAERAVGKEDLGDADDLAKQELDEYVRKIDDQIRTERSRLIKLREMLAQAKDEGQKAMLEQAVADCEEMIQKLEERRSERFSEKMGAFSAVDGLYDKQALKNESLDDLMPDAAANKKGKVKRLFERLKSNAGFRRARAAILAAISALGLVGLLGSGVKQAYATNVPVDPGTSDTGGNVGNTGGGAGEGELAPVNLTDLQRGAEQDVGEGRITIEDLTELEAGYERLENGVFYNYDEYLRPKGDAPNEKVTGWAFASRKVDVWERSDANETANLLYRVAHDQPEVLAAYAANFPSMLRQVGLDEGLTAQEIDTMMSEGENGGELQQKLLEAFKNLLESDETAIEFGTANGKVRTDYFMRSANGDKTPVGYKLGYNEAVRDNEPMFVITYTATAPDGTQRKEGMFVTAKCLQNNHFETTPQPTPTGTPVEVPVIPTPDPNNPNPEDPGTPTPPENPNPEDPGTPTPPEDPNPEDPGTPTPPENPNPEPTPTPTPEPTPTPTPDPTPTPSVEVKNPENQRQVVEQGGQTNPVGQTENIGDTGIAPTETPVTNPENNVQQVEGGMVADPNATPEQQQENHRQQEEANQNETLPDENGNNDDLGYDDYVDYIESILNQLGGNEGGTTEGGTAGVAEAGGENGTAGTAETGGGTETGAAETGGGAEGGAAN